MCNFVNKAPKTHCTLSFEFIFFSTNIILSLFAIFSEPRVSVLKVVVKIDTYVPISACLSLFLFIFHVSSLPLCVCFDKKATLKSQLLLLFLPLLTYPWRIRICNGISAKKKLCQISTKSLRCRALLADNISSNCSPSPAHPKPSLETYVF